jgi:hypothetical protein
VGDPLLPVLASEVTKRKSNIAKPYHLYFCISAFHRAVHPMLCSCTLYIFLSLLPILNPMVLNFHCQRQASVSLHTITLVFFAALYYHYSTYYPHPMSSCRATQLQYKKLYCIIPPPIHSAPYSALQKPRAKKNSALRRQLPNITAQPWPSLPSPPSHPISLIFHSPWSRLPRNW